MKPIERKMFNFRLIESQVKLVRNMNINVTDLIEKLLEKTAKNKKCPTCNRIYRKPRPKKKGPKAPPKLSN